jgi:hypothetical protein
MFASCWLGITAETAMADNDVEVGPDEVLVERKIVPTQRRGISLWGTILLIAFVGTCIFVFFGDRLGLHHSPPATVEVNTPRPLPPADP